MPTSPDGAEARHADRFTSQIIDRLDLRCHQDIKSDDIRDTAHRDEIAALKPDVGDDLAVRRRDDDFSRERCLRHGARAWNINELGFQTFLFG